MLRFDRRVCVRSDLIVECVRSDLIVDVRTLRFDRRMCVFDRRACVRSDLTVECVYAQI